MYSRSPVDMNRYDQCRLMRSVLLAFLLLTGVALCEDLPKTSFEQQPDSDIASARSILFGISAGSEENSMQDGRTFGQKRIQFMLMPMIYKMGVMMTMLAVLTVISLKGLLIGLILLVLKLSTIFGKLFAWHNEHSYGHQSHAAWKAPQPVHVHLHHTGGYEAQHHAHGSAQAYSGWESAVGGPPPGDESYYYKG